MPPTNVDLRRPSTAYLSDYVEALRKGWSPDNVRGAEAAREQIDLIAKDPTGFLDSLHDPDAKAGPVKLPDGSFVDRLPSFVRWIWDGEFCGSIGLRWQPGMSSIPDYVLGHVGFAVVPWKRCSGRARQALALLLPEARTLGLDYVELTTDPDNVASQRVIQACGGKLVERFRKAVAYGGAEALRFHIDLT